MAKTKARRRKDINPALAAMLLIGAMLALIVVSGNQLTGAPVADLPDSADAGVCQNACGEGYAACLKAGGSIEVCRATLTVCQNACLAGNEPGGLPGGGIGPQ
jgi:hypothetical protein